VVLRPDALDLASPDDTHAWSGRIINRRFAGGAVMYRVELGDAVTVEVESATGSAREGDLVGVAPTRGPFPLVPR
jgi:TOBE domain